MKKLFFVLTVFLLLFPCFAYAGQNTYTLSGTFGSNDDGTSRQDLLQSAYEQIDDFSVYPGSLKHDQSNGTDTLYVLLDGKVIGFLPETAVPYLLPLMDEIEEVTITIKRILGDKGIYFYHANATLSSPSIVFSPTPVPNTPSPDKNTSSVKSSRSDTDERSIFFIAIVLISFFAIGILIANRAQKTEAENRTVEPSRSNTPVEPSKPRPDPAKSNPERNIIPPTSKHEQTIIKGPMSYINTTLELNDRFCDSLYQNIFDSAKKNGYTIDRKQKWILHHEIASFFAMYHHLVFRLIAPNDDNLIDDACLQYMKKAFNYCNQFRHLRSLDLPTSFDFIHQRLSDYDDACFSDFYPSKHLLPFLSDQEAERLVQFPLNQAQAFFCECISRIIVGRRHDPVIYEKEIKYQPISDIFESTATSCFAMYVHTLSSVFIASTVCHYLPENVIHKVLYTIPHFSEP